MDLTRSLLEDSGEDGVEDDGGEGGVVWMLTVKIMIDDGALVVKRSV